MNSSTIAILCIIGLVVVFAFFFFLMLYTTSRHHQQISNVLTPSGFEKSDADKELVTSKFSIVGGRWPDQRAVVINLHEKRAAEYTLYVCEYHSMSGSGKAYGADRVLAGTISQDLHLHRFTIEPIPQQSGWVGKMLRSVSSSFPIPGLQKIQTPSQQFNSRFSLYAPAGLSATELISDTIMRHLLSAGNVTLDVKGDTLVLSSMDIEAERVAQTFDPHKLRRLVDLAQTLTDEFRRGKNPGINRELPQA